MPEPIFLTNDFGMYQEVIAQVGKLEFVSEGKLQDATRAAVWSFEENSEIGLGGTRFD